MRAKSGWVPVVGLALLVGAAPAAATSEYSWQLRFGAPWVESGMDHTEVEEDGTRIEALGQSGYGLGFAVEQRVSSRLGFEVGVMWNRNDVDLRITDPAVLCSGAELCIPVTASDSMEPITVTFGPDFHLTPNAKADLYVGPLVAWMVNNDLTFTADGQRLDVAVDDGLAWGGVLGLDYPFGERGWYFCGALRYFDAETDMTPAVEDAQTSTVALDPLSLAVGFGYRF